MIFIENISKKQKLLTNIQAIIIGLLILTFPYNTCDCTVGTLSILSFITMLFQKSFNFKILFREKIIIVLLVLILLTYLSVFWSNMPIHAPHADFGTAFNRFKYYFLLIPSIYFSKFSKSTIKKLLFLIIIAPLPLVVIYYLNHFGITHLYCKRNIFILFASAFLYAIFLVNLKSRRFSRVFFILILLILYSVSLFVDSKMHARGVDIGLKCLRTFKEAIYQHKYTGSWGHRLAYDIVGIKIFLKHPIFGNGVNDVTLEIMKYKKLDPQYFQGEMYLTRLTNGHLLLLDQVGIVGYLIFLYFIYLMLNIKLSDLSVEVFKNLFIISFLFIMVTEEYFTLKLTTNLFAITIALVLLYKRLDKQEKSL